MVDGIYGDDESTREFIFECLFIIALIAAFAIAGYIDWTSEQEYLQGWYEANGVANEVAYEEYLRSELNG